MSRLLGSPLFLLLLGTVLASLLIPRWAAIWQDRQPELALKSTIVQETAHATTDTVREGITLALDPPPQPSLGSNYVTLTRRWLVSRAELQTLIGTYFPDSVARCWFLYSDRVTDYIMIPRPNVSSAAAVKRIQNYLTKPQAACAPLKDVPEFSRQRHETLTQAVGDFSALSSTGNATFKNAYASLGELLLIERDRIVATIVGTDAKGFSHGWWIFH